MFLSRIALRLCNAKNRLKCTCNVSSSTQTGKHNNLEHLQSRALIQVEGVDSPTLLQGLITNDILHLPAKKLGSLYAMFLNVKGRVLCDSIIYTLGQDNHYIIECDTAVCDQVMRHLKMYKIKKQVSIQLMDSYKVYALFDPRNVNVNVKEKNGIDCVPGLLKHCKEPEISAANGETFKNMHLFCDARLNNLGLRILAQNLDLNEIPEEFQVSDYTESERTSYRRFRYMIGVGEGVVDIPPNNAFPMEANLDYLNGLNVHKGCYLGQELTARTYHTGKIRKRLLPLQLASSIAKTPEELNLYSETSQNIGKLRGIDGTHGLALLRINLVLNNEFSVGGIKTSASIPYWWPGQSDEKVKEKLEVPKTN